MKKNIDNIFKEKFEHAEITPPEEIWTDISAQLPFKKQKRRIIPIWYLVAGTAAVLAIMLLLFQNTNPSISNQKITDTPKNSTDENNFNNTNPEEPNTHQLESPSILERKNNVVQSKNNNAKNENSSAQKNKNMADEESENTPQLASPMLLERKNGVAHSQKDEAEVNHIESTGNKNAPGSEKVKKNPAEYASNNEVDHLNTNPKLDDNLHISTELRDIIKNDENMVAIDSIKQQETIIASVEDLEEVAKSEDMEKDIKPVLSKRLSITTKAGALYFDNLSGGSGLDEQFANNNSNSEITTSYGINFGYQLSEKIKIRTGISQINLVNKTQDVAYASLMNSKALNAPQFGTIAYNENAVPELGKINQTIGFIEVPSEIEYLLVDKKIGINLIGGFSTLFLNKNKISLNTENTNTNLGKANNLAEISFTANAGLGLNYKISPQFNFNVEPIFKYQLNTFKNTEDFKPYYFGLYSGFSFKF